MLEAETEHWSVERELLAEQVELLHAILRVLVAAHGGRRARVPPAFEVPRPTSAVPKPIAVRPSELAALFPAHVKAVNGDG